MEIEGQACKMKRKVSHEGPIQNSAFLGHSFFFFDRKWFNLATELNLRDIYLADSIISMHSERQILPPKLWTDSSSETHLSFLPRFYTFCYRAGCLDHWPIAIQ